METIISILKKIGVILLVLAVYYAFFSVIAWNLNPGEWGGFSRFLFAVFGFFTIIFGSQYE